MIDPTLMIAQIDAAISTLYDTEGISDDAYQRIRPLLSEVDQGATQAKRALRKLAEILPER
ncbi:MAG: hypothetical protein AAF773_00270 [Cyanobacteria bacterium P01_D01_bin.115]